MEVDETAEEERGEEEDRWEDQQDAKRGMDEESADDTKTGTAAQDERDAGRWVDEESVKETNEGARAQEGEYSQTMENEQEECHEGDVVGGEGDGVVNPAMQINGLIDPHPTRTKFVCGGCGCRQARERS